MLFVGRLYPVRAFVRFCSSPYRQLLTMAKRRRASVYINYRIKESDTETMEGVIDVDIAALEEKVQKWSAWYFEIDDAEKRGYVAFYVANVHGEIGWGDDEIKRAMEAYPHCTVYARKKLRCLVFDPKSAPVPEAELFERDLETEVRGMAADGELVSCNVRSLRELLTPPPLKRMTREAAGLDFFCPDDVTLKAGWRNRRTIGMKVSGAAVPSGHVGFIRGRSSLMRAGLEVMAGTIDADFAGDIELVVWTREDDGMVLTKGQRIAQLVVVPCYMGGSATSEIRRGGFGSTD